MFEKFTERCRKAMSLARQEAQRLGSEFIDTEHVLLGILQAGEDVDFQVLQLDLARLREEIEKHVRPSGRQVLLGQLPFSPSCKRVLELAGDEVGRRGDAVIGLSHLLLALIEEGKGAAARILGDLGITAVVARAKLGLPKKSAPGPAAAKPLRPVLLDERSLYSWARAYPSLEDRPVLQETVSSILGRSKSVALVGPGAVGKTSLILALSRAKALGLAWWLIDARLFDPRRLPEVRPVLTPGTVCFVPNAEELPKGEPADAAAVSRLILEFRDAGWETWAGANPEAVKHFEVVPVAAPDPREQQALLESASVRLRRIHGIGISTELLEQTTRLAREKWPHLIQPWGALAVLFRAESIQRESTGRGDLVQLEADIERLESLGDPESAQHARFLRQHAEGLRAASRKDLSMELIRQAVGEISAESKSP